MRRRTLPDTSYAFVDRICSKCNGEGHYPHNPWHICPRCNGTGSIGSFEGLADIFPQFHPTPFSKSLRATREGRKVSLRELAMHIGVSVCRLSEIERGFGDAPTAKEEKKIRAWMEANDE